MFCVAAPTDVGNAPGAPGADVAAAGTEGDVVLVGRELVVVGDGCDCSKSVAGAAVTLGDGVETVSVAVAWELEDRETVELGPGCRARLDVLAPGELFKLMSVRAVLRPVI